MKSKFSRYIQRFAAIPRYLIFIKIWHKFLNIWRYKQAKKRDFLSSTYLFELFGDISSLYRYMPQVDIIFLKQWRDKSANTSCLYLAHYFDLLGSGWVQVKHGMHCRGLEGARYDMGCPIPPHSAVSWLEGRINSANLAESQRIWSLVAQDYTPIDWHLDFKSGYRWSEGTWYRDVRYGHKLGVDIKVPWELGRMQHLPQLALAYELASTGQPDFASAPKYADEFRNQVLDFIATNPPRFGVNWRCTMDVGIRVANWLVAYDLFQAYGAECDSEFEAQFSRSVYQHGCHIINNLEWFPQHRANHYLADIVGLLFVAAYLPCTPEIDVWLAFAIQELIAEVKYQFYPDGGNFEASTSYHRLSAEMVVYATALVLGLPPEKQAALKEYNHRLHRVRPKLKPAPIELYSLPGSDRLIPFPAWYIERLEKMAEFTMHITKPNGHIPQIGDNDSGRFVKLQPIYHQMTVAEAKARYANLEGYAGLLDDAIYWDEDSLDHRHLIAAINGLFGRNDFSAFTGKGWLETNLIGCLAGGIQLPSYLQPSQSPAAELVRVGTKEDWVRLSDKLDSLTQEQGRQRQVLKIPVPGGDLCKGLKLYAYPNFGLYLYRSSRLYLAVRCGAIGQNGNGGHAHNDQLSIELNVDGEDWITDPGTYIYTPLRERRNEYRSVKAHFAPQIEGQEPGRLDLGLFRLGNETSVICRFYGKEGFLGMYHTPDVVIHRKILLKGEELVISDSCDHHRLLSQSLIAGNFNSNKLSTGYGKISNSRLKPTAFNILN
ncbi:MAG TPA: alginate lyase family protein [Coleofasciculaceae cyanobacterium]|jgi:hypothetical protein